MMKRIFNLLKEAFQEWNEDRAPRLAAALSYYTVFSIAPLLIVVIAIAGLAFGQEAVQGQIYRQLDGLIGADGADTVQDLIENARNPASGIFATIIGVVTLLLGAAGAFVQLRDALNTVWDVQTPPNQNGIIATIRSQFLSFAMLLGIGFLLMVSLVISALLSVFDDFLLAAGGGFLLKILSLAVSFGVITVMFAMIFKFLPDTKIEWRDVWIGAAFTSLLFNVGKFLIGLYLGNSGVASAYGAAGSLVVLLLWIYYSAQILLFGAEFTEVYSRTYGSRVPEPKAEPEAVKIAPGHGTAPIPAVTLPLVSDDAYRVDVHPEETKAMLQQRVDALTGLLAVLATFFVGLIFGSRGRS
jgi:membrane protein